LSKLLSSEVPFLDYLTLIMESTWRDVPEDVVSFCCIKPCCRMKVHNIMTGHAACTLNLDTK